MEMQEPLAFDYRGLLQEELRERQHKNQGYSARAFARDLKVAPSYLLALLKGSKLPTEERAIRMAKSLRWGPKRSQMFSTLVRYSRAKGDVARQEIRRELDRFRVISSPEWRLTLDKFSVVSDWYHFAIVEMLSLDGLTITPEAIAKRLGLTISCARQALRRLESVQLIKCEGGRTLKAHQNYVIEDIPSAAVREHHRQILEKAKLAIGHQPTHEREFSSTALALDPALLPEIKERIRRFRREIEDLVAESPQKTAIYELAIQTFRLDRV